MKNHFFLLLLLLCGCQASISELPSQMPQPTTDTVMESSLLQEASVSFPFDENTECEIHLGASKDEVLNTLHSAGLRFCDDETSNYIYSELDEYNCRLEYDSQDLIRLVYVQSVKVKTKRGVGCGDPKEKLLEQYGMPQNMQVSFDEYTVEVYEYLGDGFVLSFTLGAEDNTIYWWEISYDLPEKRIQLEDVEGNPIYLYLGMPDEELKKRLSISNSAFSEYNNGHVVETDILLLHLASTAGDPYFLLYKYEITKPGYLTSAGIGVGDSQEKIFNIYGNPDYTVKKEETFEYQYSVGGDSSNCLCFIVDINTEKVQSWCYGKVSDK